MELTKEWVEKRLPVRPKDANKGTFGKVLVIAGSKYYMGAAYFASAATYRVGAGLVTLSSIEKVCDYVIKKLPEATLIPLPEENGSISNLALDVLFDKLMEAGYEAICIGPGLTKKPVKFINEVFKLDDKKLVIDGDALNILSKTQFWWESLEIHGTEAVLTPHPGEMARLTGLSVDEIQKDRLNIAKKFAEEWGQVVVLKGANTVIASPFGEVAVSPFANPVLATAGTGDVLAGVISGMLAQGLEPFDAAAVGVYLHAVAGEILREKIGNTGTLASDLLPFLPLAIRHIQTTDRLN